MPTAVDEEWPRPPDQHPQQQKWWRSRALPLSLLKVALSGVLFWIIFSRIDIGDVKARILQLSFAPVLLVAVLLALHVLISAARWWAIIAQLEGNSSFRSTFFATLIERFVNQAVPSPFVGDGARAMALIRNGEHARIAAYSIVLDRAFAVGGVFGLVTLGSPLSLSLFKSTGVTTAVWLITALSLFGTAILLLCPDGVWARLRNLRLMHYPAGLAITLRRLLLAPRVVPAVVGSSLVAQILPIFGFLIISYDLGIDLRLLDAIALVPVIMAASILPISIAGWGVRESAAVVLLGEVGIAASDAVTLSVVFGLINVATACLGGLCWLVMANRHGNRK